MFLPLVGLKLQMEYFDDEYAAFQNFLAEEYDNLETEEKEKIKRVKSRWLGGIKPRLETIREILKPFGYSFFVGRKKNQTKVQIDGLKVLIA